MSVNMEIEGSQGEATWAMVTVIIIIVVVVIFCLLLPFYRALEKRWHHWDDLENDPRWDVENFQFATSPQVSRDPKYNRLSACSMDNSSSLGTSSSGINRGNSFRNTCVLPRFDDQVEFKLPPSYDDLFSKGTEKVNCTPPPYSATNTADTEEPINDKDQQERSTPVLATQAKNFIKKPKQKSVPTVSPLAATHSPTTQEKTRSVSTGQKKTPPSSTPTSSTPASSTPARQDRNTTVAAPKQAPIRAATKTIIKTDTIPSAPSKTNTKKTLPTSTPASSQPARSIPASSTPAGQDKNTTVAATKQTPVRTATKTDTFPSAPAKTNKKKTLPTSTPVSSQPPAAPPKKTNSKVLTKSTPVAAQGQQNSLQPSLAPVVPVKKTYKKIKKTAPSQENVKSG